jgi:ABC-type glycerol-3-phosphate transport system substrate-binding protein
MLVYKEYDANNNLVTSGIEGAHSGSTAWCVWSKSSVKNAAYLFVKFASGEEGQRILSKAGTIIANQKSVAEEMVKEDVDAGKSPENLEIFSKGAEYQTPGDWWFLKDGDWIDAEGCWANYLNQTVRNYKATIPAFYKTNDYLGTFDKLLKYTKK